MSVREFFGERGARAAAAARKPRFNLGQVYTVVITVLFVFTLMLVVSGRLQVGNADTVTHTTCQLMYSAGITGGSGLGGGGQNPAVSGEYTLGGWSGGTGEIFGSAKYYISWNNNGGVSENMNVAGTVFACNQADTSPIGASTPTGALRYTFSIDNGNETFVPFVNPAIPQGVFQFTNSQLVASGPSGGAVVDLKGYNFNINGFQFTLNGQQVSIHDGATLKVSIDMQWAGALNSGGWASIATDQTVLRSGIVSGYWGQSLYHVNDTAVFSWQVPAVTLGGQTAYSLSIIDDDTGNAVGGYSNSAISSLFGTASVKIAPSLFVPGGINQLHAVISSSILNAASVPVSMRFSTTNGPTVTKVTFNQAYYHQGDRIVVNWTASPDPATRLPILKYRVEASILGAFVLSPQFINGTTASFSAAATGPLDVFVTAYDSYGPGAVYHAVSTVGNPVDICSVFPSLPQCGGSAGGFIIPGYWLWATAALLGGGLGLILIGYLVPSPPGSGMLGVSVARGLLMVLGILLAAAGVIMFFGIVVNWLDSLLSWPPLLKWILSRGPVT